MDLSYTVGWPIAKAAFAHVMTRVEQGKISWTDSNAIWQARTDGKHHAYMGQHRGGQVVTEPSNSVQHRPNGNSSRRQGRTMPGVIKEFTCNNFNAGYCSESYDHMDATLPQKYIHACHNCYGNPAVPTREQQHKAKFCKYKGQQ